MTLPCFGLEKLINRFIAPVLSQLGLTVFQVARPMQKPLGEKKVSVVIPARNEAGNIEDAVRRTPTLGEHTELIFIEGNSTDQTWAEIERVRRAYPDLDVKAMRQSGKGKGNAVREAFEAATGEILMTESGLSAKITRVQMGKRSRGSFSLIRSKRRMTTKSAMIPGNRRRKGKVIPIVPRRR